MTATWPAMSIAEATKLLTAPGSPLEMETVVIDGRPTRAWKNAPPTLQHCFAIGRNRITQAITADGCQSVEAIGAALRAGTNCGSCIPELRRIITSETARHAA